MFKLFGKIGLGLFVLLGLGGIAAGHSSPVSTVKPAASATASATPFVQHLEAVAAPLVPTVQPQITNTASAKPNQTPATAYRPTPVPYVSPTNHPTPTPTPQPVPTATPVLSNNGYYSNTDGTQVHDPASTSNNSVPAGATAQCSDGSYSFSLHRSGTCSHHSGVAQWL